MKDIILFDLDGTLVDNSEGIVKSVYYALDCLGVTEDEPEKLKRFIGPPLESAFREFYQLNDTGVRRAVEKYRERYSKKGVWECRLYEGISPLLNRLHEAGKILCVATSKPQVFMEEILASLGVKKYFTVQVGATLDGTFCEKSDIIQTVIAQLPGRKVSEMLMVGDRKFDVFGAKRCGMESVGVYYGFAEQGELETAGAEYIAQDVKELENLLCASL